MNKVTETGADVGSPFSPLRLCLFFFSGMFFDGNHTYMIEPGGQGSGDVSTLQIFTYVVGAGDGFSQRGLLIFSSFIFSRPAASQSC